MINTQYRLISPLSIEVQCHNIDVDGGEILVRPDMLSICKADMRYYFGQRNPSVLKKRLPLTLIHEACGTVLYDAKGILRSGQQVILLPNIPGKEKGCAENYRTDSLFRSSRADGFMQEIVSMDENQVLPIEGVKPEIAAMTEFISVGTHAIRSYLDRIQTIPEHVAVWGDGALGYIVCTLIRHFLPQTRLTIIGTHETKLSVFPFTDEQLTTAELEPKNQFDAAFECVGGRGSASAIRQMIDTVYPEGILSLMGVCEEPVAIDTRMVLEKGLTLIGRSRSGREDFVETIHLLEQKPFFANRMKVLISNVCRVREIGDIHSAFGQSRIADFKVIMDWRI